ncbi:UNKNOWN [Stylonychia lemnae]|uniref:Uncharacterized protein n=1 Tax=Stylonychia lemnae TaxID=5949 RepID=A0A078BBB4_STYLE|nr:UNKNOWN [Stylonychia lemnae]|eukprot:CDW91486.1 UNKNOWN [Stylonychia lemnae]
MRQQKMIANLTLSKFQRKLLPYLKNYLIESSYSRNFEKNKKIDEIQTYNQVKILDSLSELMIQLYAGSREHHNIDNQDLVDNIFVIKPLTKDGDKNLKMKFFTGILRMFIKANLNESKAIYRKNQTHNLADLDNDAQNQNNRFSDNKELKVKIQQSLKNIKNQQIDFRIYEEVPSTSQRKNEYNIDDLEKQFKQAMDQVEQENQSVQNSDTLMQIQTIQKDDNRSQDLKQNEWE